MSAEEAQAVALLALMLGVLCVAALFSIAGSLSSILYVLRDINSHWKDKHRADDHDRRMGRIRGDK